MLYFLPEITDFNRRLHNVSRVDMEEIEIADEICCPKDPPLPCSPAFKELGNLIIAEQRLQISKNPDEAKSLYLEL